MKDEISAFFDNYATLFNEGITTGRPAVDKIQNCFAEYFVESSPVGIMGGKNDESFAQKIPQGYEHYQAIGIYQMEILSKDIKTIDEFHAMATINWSSSYKKDNGDKGVIVFDVTYLVNMKNDPKIFAYITGDEQAVLKEHGLV